MCERQGMKKRIQLLRHMYIYKLKILRNNNVDIYLKTYHWNPILKPNPYAVYLKDKLTYKMQKQQLGKN